MREELGGKLTNDEISTLLLTSEGNYCHYRKSNSERSKDLARRKLKQQK